MKIENNNSLKEKRGDDYIKELKQQFEEASQSYNERINAERENYDIKRIELQQKCKELEKENRHLKGIQSAILKKLDTMESLFSK